MLDVIDQQTLRAVARRIDPASRLLRFWQPTGGISAQVAAFALAGADGQNRQMFLRRHGEADLQLNPQIAADEFRLLQFLTQAGLPVPQPYYLDTSCELFSTPYLVIEYIEGQPEYGPEDITAFSDQLAATLASIHRVDGSAFDLAFLPEPQARYAGYLHERPAALDESLNEGRIRATLEAAGPLPPLNTPVLLHHDFWPGNLLWRAGQLVAVIDWEDAAYGDPLADLANTRLEVLWAFGVETMQHFTQAYQARMPALDFSSLPYWDLCVALRQITKMPALYDGWADLGRPDITAVTMRAAHQWFVAQALKRV